MPILQYRNKVGSLEEKRADLQLIRQHYHGQLIINDTIELIEYADGLHIGQEDLVAINPDKKVAISMIREQISEKILGLSTHNQEEIEEANELDLHYIGLGAYRSTQTKSDATVGGKELLSLAKLSKHPVGIIGGVRLDDDLGEDVAYRVIGSGLYNIV